MLAYLQRIVDECGKGACVILCLLMLVNFVTGTAVVVLTTTDTSAESYYGDQGLHFVSITGDSSLVPRSKPFYYYFVLENVKSTKNIGLYLFVFFYIPI